MALFHKKRMFQLGNRLTACASFVRPGCKLVDIGTDHAYLPIFLVKNNQIERAIASDIRIGPLQKAAMHVKKYGVEDLVQTRLSDGLEVIFENEADDILIAGMGGELIAKIIEAADWLRNPEKHLILQPMTTAEDLRRSLKREGFTVLEEKAAIEDGKVYSVMLAVYDPLHPNTDPLFPYIGLVDASSEEGKAYIEKQIRLFQNKVDGLTRAGREESAEPYKALICKLQDRIIQTGRNHE